MSVRATVRACQGCAEEVVSAPLGKRKDKLWCSDKCKQKTLRDRKWIRVSVLLESGGLKARAELREVFGSQIAGAVSRQALMKARIENLESLEG
jgi:hypothetical protein